MNEVLGNALEVMWCCLHDEIFESADNVGRNL